MGRGHRLMDKRSDLRRFLDSKAFDCLLLLVVSIVVTSLWFRGNSLAIGGDFAVIPFYTSQTASRYLSAWNFWIDAGNPIPSIISNQVPILDFLFYYTLGTANIPIFLNERIYATLFSYFLGGVSTYFLVRILFETKVNSPRLAAMVAGVFYILNPIYVYSPGYTFILGSAIARASLPLALFLLVAGVTRRNLRYAVVLGLSTVLMFSVFARAMEFGFFILMSLVLAIPHVLPTIKKRRVATLRFVSIFVIVSSATAIIANLFWIAPFLGNYEVFQQELASSPSSLISFESQFTVLPNLFRLQGYWPFFVGDYVPYASYFTHPIVILATFAIPIIVLASLALPRRWNAEITGLSLLLVVFLLLGLGTNLPFNLYESSVSFVPFFKLFRDPWVFIQPLSLVYSILFGLSFSHFAHFLIRRTKFRNLSKVASFAVATSLLAIVSGPVLSGAVYTNWYQPSEKGVSIPQEYAELNTWLEQKECDCATMIVPRLSGAYIATSWGYQGANTLYQNLFSTRLVTGSGAAIYGLQPPHARQFLDYVYTLMSVGNPLSSLTSLNDTIQIESWRFVVEAQAETDSIRPSTMITPWNERALEWELGPVVDEASGDYYIYHEFETARDWSTQRWLLLWVYSATDLSNLFFGVGDSSGNTGWYLLREHSLLASSSWNLFALPTSYPDVGSYDLTSTSHFDLSYGLSRGTDSARLGGDTLVFGPVHLSSGGVSEDFIQLLLRVLNVRYIVADPTFDYTLYPRIDVRPYIETFSNWTEILPVRKFGNLTVYENKQYGSLISIPQKWVQASSIYALPDEFDRSPNKSDISGFLISDEIDGKGFTSKGRISWIKQTASTRFAVQVVGNGSFLLVLSTAFDPLWRATVDGRVLDSHILVNGYANGWQLNASDGLTIIIDYQPQAMHDVALWFSAAFVSVGLLLLTLGNIRLWSSLQRLRGWLLIPKVKQ